MTINKSGMSTSKYKSWALFLATLQANDSKIGPIWDLMYDAIYLVPQHPVYWMKNNIESELDVS